MDLNQAMLLLARGLERAGAQVEDLVDQVRTHLLQLLAVGKIPHGLTPGDEEALMDWATTQRQQGTDLAVHYEQMLRYDIISHEAGLAVREERRQHRRMGAYYTTDVIVRYMVERARELMPSAATVIDPACGAGAFLAEADRAFSPLERLAGWDLDPTAVLLCRAMLPHADLKVQDALLTAAPGGYDLCLGNPPYISSGLRGAVAHDPERLRALRERYPYSAEYKLNTYALFIERGLELLRPGGVIGYIVPDSFLTGRYFAGLRRLLLQYSVLELTLIRQDFWAHGRVGQSVILFVRKEPALPGHRVRVRICERPADLADGQATEVPLTDLVWGSLDRFRLVPDVTHRVTLRQMERNATPLGHWLRSYSGLIGRQGQGSLLLPPDGGRQSCNGSVGRVLRSGREIDRYWLNWGGHHACLDPALIKSGGNRGYYEQPKLLLRQTADSLRAVYDDQGYYCLNNIHLLTPARAETNLHALLGLINSEPFSRFYRAVSMEFGRLYAQVDLDILESLPVPNLQPGLADLEALVRSRKNAAPSRAALIEQQIDALVERLYASSSGDCGAGSW